MRKKNRSQMWPMEFILGGILTIAVIVLLGYGLRTEEEGGGDPVASGPVALRHEIEVNSRPAVEPDHGMPTVIETSALSRSAAAEPAARPGAEVALAATAVGEAAPEPASFAAAEALYVAGAYEDAAASFAVYVFENQANPWGYYMLGLAEYRSGRLGEAEAALRAAIDIEPDEAKTWANLSRVLTAAGAAEPALAAAERAVALDPASGSAARLLGRTLHNLDRPEDAIAAYSTALALDPGDAWALNNLGLILIEQKRFVEALEPLALAARLDDRVAVFQNNLGVALEASGFPAAASHAYLRAVEVDPSHGRAQVNLARAELLEPEAASPSLASLSSDLELRLVAGAFPWLAATEIADGGEEYAPGAAAEANPVGEELAASAAPEELPTVARNAPGL